MFLALTVLSWFGILKGVGTLLFPVLVVLCWRPLQEMVRGASGRGRAIAAGVGVILAAWVASYAYLTWGVPAIGTALGLPSLTSANQDQFDAQFRAAPALMGFLVVVVGPVQEELIYRYGLFRALERFGPVVAHGVAGLAFAAQHSVAGLLAGDAAQLVPALGYLGVGLTLTLVYHRTRSLLAPVLGHMLANALSVVDALL